MFASQVEENMSPSADVRKASGLKILQIGVPGVSVFGKNSM